MDRLSIGCRGRRFGAAHAPSSDVRSGHPALRSLHAGWASTSCLRSPPRPAPASWAAPHRCNRPGAVQACHLRWRETITA